MFMDEDVTISKPKSSKPEKKRSINTWGIYFSLFFIIVGLIWYGVNMGVIPISFLQEQAGPILLVIIGIIILIKSF